MKPKISKEATLTYDQQLEGDRLLGVEGVAVTKAGFVEFFNINSKSECGFLSCSLKEVGCKTKLANPNVTIDRRSPYNFHVKSDPKGYKVKLCY